MRSPHAQRTLSRRDFLASAAVGTLVLAAPFSRLGATSSGVGEPTGAPGMGSFGSDGWDVPFFDYQGPRVFSPPQRAGTVAKMPADPVFLLGNHHCKAFVGISGRTELLAGARGWQRVEQATLASTTLFVDGAEHRLDGAEATARRFSPGGAFFSWAGKGVAVERRVCVAPSVEVGEGVAAVFARTDLSNPGRHSVPVRLVQRWGLRLEPLGVDLGRPEEGGLAYLPAAVTDAAACSVAFTPTSSDKLVLAVGPQERARFDAHPLSWTGALLDGSGTWTFEKKDETTLVATLTSEYVLAPGQRATTCVCTGFYFASAGETQAGWLAAARQAEQGLAWSEPFPAAKAWSALLPALSSEADAELRRELRWHAATLDALAIRSAFTQETVIPQGMAYDFSGGMRAAPRDHLQHLVAVTEHRPALARSALRHTLSQVMPSGEMAYTETGCGFISNLLWKPSDSQLYLFWALAIYLRNTHDHRLLADRVKETAPQTAETPLVITVLERAFAYLRDEVGVGPHGLVRLLNSDWNDQLIRYSALGESYWTSESVANTALVVLMWQELEPQFQAAERLPADVGSRVARLRESMALWARKQSEALQQQTAGRTTLRRAYLKGSKVNLDEYLFLEPHGFAFQVNALPDTWRRAALAAVYEKLVRDEPSLARHMDRATPNTGQFYPGTVEDGGCWYALHGPLALGAAKVDAELGRELFERMLLRRTSKHAPDHFVGWWSSLDAIDSTLSPWTGLPTQAWEAWAFPLYCAHVHAWPLFVYNERARLRRHTP
ncbi:MAG: hypothetical protein SFV32_09225 [Opitutaceae bacterium]|nr:hypothetical protein [Opitutaceae bacterium]